MLQTTPIARSKTAALSRVVDSVGKGYDRYTSGSVSAEKAERLLRKFHERHGIGLTPAQRLQRKSQGKANAILAIYWLPEAEVVQWVLLFSPGDLSSPEHLRDITQKPRLTWLGYELVRHASRGKISWTWQRTKSAMQELYALCTDALRRHQLHRVDEALTRMAQQPGFHGVREQTKTLYAWLCQHGYSKSCPPLYYVQKISHGERFVVGE